MRLPMSFGAAALIGAVMMMMPASAAPLAGALSKGLLGQSSGNSLVVQVQRRRGRGGRGRGWGGNGGAAAAGVVGGLLLGAIIAGEAQRQQAVEYCMSRFRSYNPETGTYVDNRGRIRRCP